MLNPKIQIYKNLGKQVSDIQDFQYTEAELYLKHRIHKVHLLDILAWCHHT